MTDTANVLAAMTSPFGGTAGVTCTGPYTLTFTADGVYQGGFEAVCGMGPVTGTGQAAYTGSYTADGATVVVQGVTGSGSMTIGGTTVPMVDADMFASSGTLDYTLDGDVLTLHIPVGGTTVDVTLTRSA